jgi:cyclopropane fatty-acyl-phospholipid synthase-like methyltransferase
VIQSKHLSWLEFWEHKNPIYVSDRHRAAHYRHLAQDILSLELQPNSKVLDYGCGDALEAKLVVGHAAVLYLYDAASSVRERLKCRFLHEPRIIVLNDMANLMDDSLDLIIVNSVLQYISVSELTVLLERWRKMLKPKGRLVLSDVIHPRSTMATDTFELLRFAWHERFLLDVAIGLVAMFFSEYRQLRRDLNLGAYTENDLLWRLKAAGFVAQRRDSNLGFNRKRMTFIAVPSTEENP